MKASTKPSFATSSGALSSPNSFRAYSMYLLLPFSAFFRIAAVRTALPSSVSSPKASACFYSSALDIGLSAQSFNSDLMVLFLRRAMPDAMPPAFVIFLCSFSVRLLNGIRLSSFLAMPQSPAFLRLCGKPNIKNPPARTPTRREAVPMPGWRTIHEKSGPHISASRVFSCYTITHSVCDMCDNFKHPALLPFAFPG